MPSRHERDQVTTGSASKIENSMRALAGQGVEERIHVLGYVMIFGAEPKSFCRRFVMLEGSARNFV